MCLRSRFPTVQRRQICSLSRLCGVNPLSWPSFRQCGRLFVRFHIRHQFHHCHFKCGCQLVNDEEGRHPLTAFDEREMGAVNFRPVRECFLTDLGDQPAAAGGRASFDWRRMGLQRLRSVRRRRGATHPRTPTGRPRNPRSRFPHMLFSEEMKTTSRCHGETEQVEGRTFLLLWRPSPHAVRRLRSAVYKAQLAGSTPT